MRKNGINREICPIEGGICAPEGYKANAVACGIKKDGDLDFGMIFSERRCAVACVYATGNTLGAPVKVSKKNMRNGYIRAILVNGGVANAIAEDGEELAYSVCDLLFPYCVERTEIVIASTGKIGQRLSVAPFQKEIKTLWAGLASSNEKSQMVAKAIRSEGAEGKQLAFSFDLGDYPCKIGGIFKGGAQVSPNTATFLAFLTTDVNISTPMLQKALTATVKETFNLLNLDGVSSPNDTVCIMANGRAGNYKIDCEDAEYKKFLLALRLVFTEICKAVAKENAQKVIICHVQRAISKEVSRCMSKALVGTNAVKKMIIEGKLDVEGVVSAVLASGNSIKPEKMQLGVRSEKGEVIFFEGGCTLPIIDGVMQRITNAEEVELFVCLNQGNFQSVAFGRVGL